MKLELTRRAVRDIHQISTYSTETFGPLIAEEYLDAIDDALLAITSKPALIQVRPEWSGRLRFYRVRQHYLICDIIDTCIYVLGMIHGSRDIPNRIAELEPMLILEAEARAKRLISDLE